MLMTSNVMLSHGYNVRDLPISSILSIPKYIKSSLCNNDNYKGLSLFNAICKVFDYVILYLCGNCFETSDL